MKKAQMQERFKALLEDRRERLLQAVRKEERPTAMMWYGQICGIADAMRTMELVDYDQAQYIKDTAFALYRNKGAEDEPC